MKAPDLSELDDAMAKVPFGTHAKERVNLAGQVMIAPTGNKIVEQAPKGVPLSEREQHLLRQMICLLIANGESTKATAAKLGLTEACVIGHVESQKGMEMIVRFQHDTCPDPRTRLKKMASIALDVQTKLLLSPTTADGVKAKVANEVLDRDMGKAIQVTENRNINFDLKDAQQIDRALSASQDKLKRIEEMQKKLAIKV